MPSAKTFELITLDPGGWNDVSGLGLRKEDGEEEDALTLKDASGTTVLQLRFVLK